MAQPCSAVALAIGMGSLSCGDQEATKPSGREDARRIETVIAPQGQYVHFPLCEEGQTCGRISGGVDLRMVACSAKVSCEPRLLHDPRNLERGATLVSGFSCGFPEGTPPQDALLAYHPTVRCYTAGDPADPTTWAPAGGIEPAFISGDHVFYSQEVGAAGDVYTNAALLMRPLKDASWNAASSSYGFCDLTAWGTIAFSGRDEGPFADPGCTAAGCARKRRGALTQWAPAIRWRALVRWDPIDGWDCHVNGSSRRPGSSD